MKQDERHHTSDDIFVGIDLATRQHQVVRAVSTPLRQPSSAFTVATPRW